jgi:hypothetical protein
MMGDKLRLMFWDLPTDGCEWTVEVHPSGVVALRCYEPITKTRGRLAFDEDADIEFIKSVMHRVGFSIKQGE